MKPTLTEICYLIQLLTHFKAKAVIENVRLTIFKLDQSMRARISLKLKRECRPEMEVGTHFTGFATLKECQHEISNDGQLCNK